MGALRGEGVAIRRLVGGEDRAPAERERLGERRMGRKLLVPVVHLVERHRCGAAGLGRLDAVPERERAAQHAEHDLAVVAPLALGELLVGHQVSPSRRAP